jgi:hypothetical protein
MQKGEVTIEIPEIDIEEMLQRQRVRKLDNHLRLESLLASERLR